VTPEQDLEARILGAPLELDRDEVSALAGVPEEVAREVWVALGFPAHEAGEEAFTRLDAEALQRCRAIVETGVVDASTLLILARTMGQGMARLAEAQIDALRSSAAGMTLEDVIASSAESADTILPELEQLVVHVWRRQLAAATMRSLAAVGREGLPVLVVGFVDLVGFTRSTQKWSAQDLEEVLESFERDTALRVTARGGRVIKTLGDEVMWVVEDPVAGAEIALASVEAHEADESLPRVRAGLALGGVVQRLGDVFGEPVNLASRLTSEARPGSVLVDARVAEALEGSPALLLSRLHGRHVRGYRSVRPVLVRRSTDPGET
jgi:adenylate cyclase